MNKFVIALLALTCASCAGNPANTTALPNASARVPRAAAPLLFVASVSSPWARIAEYPATGGAPLRTVSKGIVGPRGFAIDGLGTLYVVNHPTFSSYDVTEYDAGSTSVARTLARGIGVPSVVTADALGNFYFLNAKQPLVKYAHASTRPSYTTNAGLCGAQTAFPDLAADAAGDAYVLNECDKRSLKQVVLEYGSDGTLQRSFDVPNADLSSFIAVDATGRVYTQFLSITQGQMALGEYDPGQTQLTTTAYFGPSKPLFAEGYTPVVDDQTGEAIANLYACTKTACSSALYVFEAGATAPKLTIDLGSDAVVGPPRVGADDTIYVEVGSPKGAESIRAYAHGSSKFKTIMQGRSIGGLLFVWPNAGGGKLEAASANPLLDRRVFR